MALFVDGPASTIGDLTDQDAGLLDVALNTGINLSTKLRLAIEEIRTDLHLWLIRPRSALYPVIAPEPVWGPTLRIEQIVVTPPLKRWETMHTLALVYRDAYFSQLVDRYQAKWQEYAKLTRDASESFIASGMGLVADPVVRGHATGTLHDSRNAEWRNILRQRDLGERDESGGFALDCFFDHGYRWKSDDGRGDRYA